MIEPNDRQDEGCSQRFDDLMLRYREACPGPEPSVDFMPRLWDKIESRQRFSLQLRRWARGFITVAAAASMLFAVLQAIPAKNSPVYAATYLDALAEEQAPDSLVFQDVALVDAPRDRMPGAWTLERTQK